jgi:hypothetical protein
MNKKIVYWVITLLLVCTVSATSVSAEQDIQPVNMTLSGSIMDVDQGGALKLFDINLKGAPGTANARGVGWTGPPLPYSELPIDNVCNDISAFSPYSGLLFEEFQMTINFKDGSMLFANLADGYICFSPSIAVGTYIIAGGNGRFEAASGWLFVEINAHRFAEEGHPSLVTAETGTLTGEIILP